MSKEISNSAIDLVDKVWTKLSSSDYSYSQKYFRSLELVFNAFREYILENDISVYSPEIGEQFLVDKYGIEKGAVSDKSLPAQRVITVLSEYQVLGIIVPRQRKNKDVAKCFSECVNKYLSKLEKENYKRPKTLQRIRGILIFFTDFLYQNNVSDISKINIEDINLYYKNCLKCYGSHYVRDHVNTIHKFLAYLYENGYLQDDLSLKMLTIKRPYGHVPKHLPDTFTEEELNAILAAVDRENSAGKRDYAILMVAIKLGLRTGDIRNLSAENLNWEKMEVRLIQEKTGTELILPLPQDVGWAVIDYLKFGRPKCCTAKEIFVRSVTPFVALTNYDAILSKYLKKAGISLRNKYHYGFHTLRHSLASNLLKEEIPITVVQGVLGHESPDTTKRFYTSVDTNQLAECALEIPEI